MEDSVVNEIQSVNQIPTTYLIPAAKVDVIPIPTERPLYATMTGLEQLNMASARVPPGSRIWLGGKEFFIWLVSIVRSIPALKARPAPVKMTTLTRSSTSKASKRTMRSCIMLLVIALSLSGRFSVTICIADTPDIASG